MIFLPGHQTFFKKDGMTISYGRCDILKLMENNSADIFSGIICPVFPKSRDTFHSFPKGLSSLLKLI